MKAPKNTPSLLSALEECADYLAEFFEEGRKHRVVRNADAAIAGAKRQRRAVVLSIALRDALAQLLARAEKGLDQSPTHDGLQNCQAISHARAVLARARRKGGKL